MEGTHAIAIRYAGQLFFSLDSLSRFVKTSTKKFYREMEMNSLKFHSIRISNNELRRYSLLIKFLRFVL